MTINAELERLRARRAVASRRIDMIDQGAQIAYDDGTPIDMSSERDRLIEVVAEVDRRVAAIELAERPAADGDRIH